MRTEKEIEELRNELSRMIDHIVDFGSSEESENEDVDFANDVLDVIDWVLGKIKTDDFKLDGINNLVICLTNIK